MNSQRSAWLRSTAGDAAEVPPAPIASAAAVQRQPATAVTRTIALLLLMRSPLSGQEVAHRLAGARAGDRRALGRLRHTDRHEPREAVVLIPLHKRSEAARSLQPGDDRGVSIVAGERGPIGESRANAAQRLAAERRADRGPHLSRQRPHLGMRYRHLEALVGGSPFE